MKYQDNVYVVKDIREINAYDLKKNDIIYIIDNCSHIQLILTKIKGHFYYFETDSQVVDGTLALSYNKIKITNFHTYININNKLFLIDSQEQEQDSIYSYGRFDLFDDTRDEEDVIFSEFIKLYQEDTKGMFKYKTLETNCNNLKIIYNLLKIKLDYQTLIICQKFSYNIKYNNVRKTNFYIIVDDEKIQSELNEYMSFLNFPISKNKKTYNAKGKDIKKVKVMFLEKYFRNEIKQFKYLNYFINKLLKEINDIEFLKFKKIIKLINELNLGKTLDLEKLNNTVLHLNQYFDIKELFNYVTPVYKSHGFIGLNENNMFYKNKWISSIDHTTSYDLRLENVAELCENLMNFNQNSRSYDINPITGDVIDGKKLYEDLSGIILYINGKNRYYKKYLGYYIVTWDNDFIKDLDQKYKLVEKLRTC